MAVARLLLMSPADGSAVVACVPGWRDGLDVLGPCFESAAAAGVPVVYMDGAHRAYLLRRYEELRRTPPEEIPGLPALSIGRVLTFPGRDYTSEADKRTDLAARAMEKFPAARYLLFLDADERLESPPGALADWLVSRPDSELWCSLRLYQDRDGLRDGYWLPRIIRAHPSLSWIGHRDWDVVREIDGVTRTIAATGSAHVRGHSDVPWDVARIRHDRYLRPEWRLRMSGRFARLHRGEHGRCRSARDGVHRYVLDARDWACSECGRRVPVHPGDDTIEDEIA